MKKFILIAISSLTLLSCAKVEAQAIPTVEIVTQKEIVMQIDSDKEKRIRLVGDFRNIRDMLNPRIAGYEKAIYRTQHTIIYQNAENYQDGAGQPETEKSMLANGGYVNQEKLDRLNSDLLSFQEQKNLLIRDIELIAKHLNLNLKYDDDVTIEEWNHKVNGKDGK